MHYSIEFSVLSWSHIIVEYRMYVKSFTCFAPVDAWSSVLISRMIHTSFVSVALSKVLGSSQETLQGLCSTRKKMTEAPFNNMHMEIIMKDN